MKGKRKDMRQLSGHIKVYELERRDTVSARSYRIVGLSEFVRTRHSFGKGAATYDYDFNGAVALLRTITLDTEKYTYDDLRTMFAVYMVYRHKPDGNGNVTIDCEPLYDEDGNHIVLRSDELTETPSALLNHHIGIVSRRQPDGSYANGTYITLTLDSNKL